MKYVAAYLLAHLGGKEQPSAADVKKILESVGATVEEDKLNFLMEQVKGKNPTELIAEGKSKLASVPTGPAVAAAAPAAGGAAPAAEKKEEKKEEPKEESDDDMGFGLFD